MNLQGFYSCWSRKSFIFESGISIEKNTNLKVAFRRGDFLRLNSEKGGQCRSGFTGNMRIYPPLEAEKYNMLIRTYAYYLHLLISERREEKFFPLK